MVYKTGGVGMEIIQKILLHLKHCLHGLFFFFFKGELKKFMKYSYTKDKHNNSTQILKI